MRTCLLALLMSSALLSVAGAEQLAVPPRLVSPWFVFEPGQDNLARVRPNADLLDCLSVCGSPSAEFVSQCHALGIRVHLLVTGIDGNNAQEFATPAARQKLIGYYLSCCRDRGVDGVDLDFEGLDREVRPAYSALLREASQALHAAGKELSMCVSYVMCTARSRGGPVPDAEADIDGGWYDPQVIGQTCDTVRVMCYDMTSASSTAVGPVSTTPWARDAMAYWGCYVPCEKLVMGLPAYSRDFAMTGRREAASPYAPAPDLPVGHPMQTLWLPYEALHQYRYADPGGVEHVFFASDEASTRAHLETATALGLPRIGFWHYAAVTPEEWEAVRAWVRGRP